MMARDGVKRNKKRVPVSEIRAVLRELLSSGLLTKQTFKDLCPVAQSAGPCGFAVVGRIFEAFGVAAYSTRGEFELTDAGAATTLLGEAVRA
jgi:hypothetical protein